MKPQSRYLLPSAGPTSHLAGGKTLGEKNGINNCDQLSCTSSDNYFLLIRNVFDEVVAEMKCIISKLSIALGFTLLQINSASANQPIRMLTFDGLAKYADRFEILPSDDCKSFEMRSWGRVVDKDSNDLSRNDMIDLTLHSGPVNIEANIWKVPELPAQLKNLRTNCVDIPKVGEI